MARGTRKAASDSLTQRLADQQAPDLSNIQPPTDVDGFEALGETGRTAYTRFFRSRDGWTQADLTLIVIAAAALELIERAEAELKAGPLLVPSQKGGPRPSPLLLLIDQQRVIVMRALRDAHLRSRDGASPTSTAAVPASPSQGTKNTGNVADFDQWLK